MTNVMGHCEDFVKQLPNKNFMKNKRANLCKAFSKGPDK